MPTPSAILARPAPPAVPLSASFRDAVRADIGAITETDTNGTIASAGGVLAISGTPAAGDGINNATAALSRRRGRALLVDVPTLTTIPAGSPALGWGQNPAPTDAAVDIGVAYSSTTALLLKTGTTTIDTVTLGAAPHSLAFIQRATGGYLLGRSGGSGPYTLLWVYNTGAAAEYAKLRLAASAINHTVRSFKVVDLARPWTLHDYAPAAMRAATPASGLTPLYAHTADVILEFSFTYTTGQRAGVAFRTHTPGQSSNYWRCFASAGAAVTLDQTVAGSATVRITSAAAFTNGAAYRVVVVADSNVYRVYVNDVLKGTYTDAGSFQVGETLSYVAFAESPITEVIWWPRRLDIPAAAIDA